MPFRINQLIIVVSVLFDKHLIVGSWLIRWIGYSDKVNYNRKCLNKVLEATCIDLIFWHWMGITKRPIHNVYVSS